MELHNTLVLGFIGAFMMVAFLIVSAFALSTWLDYRKGKLQRGSKEKSPVVKVGGRNGFPKLEGDFLQTLVIIGLFGVVFFMVFELIAAADNNRRAIAYLEETQGGTFTLFDVNSEKEPKLLGYRGNNKFDVTQELNGETLSYTVTFENGEKPVIQDYTPTDE